VRPETIASRRRLYLLARLVVARNYRHELTLASVARALESSPRQLQRAYAQFGLSFSEDLTARRMAAAAELLLEQRSIPIASVAWLVGYNQPSYFARAFRRRFGVSPVRFRERPLVAEGSRYRASSRAAGAIAAVPTGSPIASSSAASSAGSAPGRRRRISVPPAGADSAAIVPPC